MPKFTSIRPVLFVWLCKCIGGGDQGAPDANALNITVSPDDEVLLPQSVNRVKPTILIGMMVSDREPLRKIEAHRRSLRNFTEKGNPKCDIKLFFLYGRSQLQTVVTGPDIIRGRFAENMNNGKTLRWFRWAVTWFRRNRKYVDPRSVVIKMDSDTAVKWELLDSLIPTFRSPTYFGKRSGFNMCNTVQWAQCLIGRVPQELCTCPECTPEAGFDGKCWLYMAGGFYGVSLSIADKLIRCWRMKDAVGIEDALFGLTIKRCRISVQVHHIDGSVFRHLRYLKRWTVEEVDVFNDTTLRLLSALRT